jgi:Na+-translocating ferredoxin:NAD+ oxidoreductase subunit E
MSNLKILMNGIITENPTFVLLLGMCPTLGTTSSAINGMSMGLATMFVLICSNIIQARTDTTVTINAPRPKK